MYVTEELAISNAATPLPGTGGASLYLTAGEGADRFPDPAVVGSYRVLIEPEEDQATPGNAEVALATARVGDVLTISRAQAGSVARDIQDGDLVRMLKAAGTGGGGSYPGSYPIINADISASAAIDVTKLAGGTDGFYLKSVAGVPTWASVSAGVPDPLLLTNDITARSTLSTQTRIGSVGPSGEPGISFSAALDTTLYRSAAGTLKIAGTVDAAAYRVAGTLLSASHLSNGVLGTGAVMLATANTLTTVATLNASVDNFDPEGTGLLTRNLLRIDGAGDINITGIVAPGVAFPLTIVNRSQRKITLKHATTSVAANQFFCPGDQDLVIPWRGVAVCIYATAANRWYVSSLQVDLAGVLAFGTLPGSKMAVFVASGASHAVGAVPDPGAVAGTTKFLREDATWVAPTSYTGSYPIVNADVAAGAAIAYSKLNLANSIVTGDIAANAVDNADLRAGVALSVVGRSANSGGNVADIAGVNNQVLRVSGSVLGFGAIDISTAQVTGTLPVAQGGTGVTSSTGSGANALATSPTLVTPVIGAATGTSLAVTGAVTSSGPTSGIGYATGAGASVAQTGSITTTVISNTVTGLITLFSGARASQVSNAFTLTNSAIAATDLVLVTHVSGGTLGAYNVCATAGAGSATITVRNVHTASLTEAPVLRYAVIKSVNA